MLLLMKQIILELRIVYTGCLLLLSIFNKVNSWGVLDNVNSNNNNKLVYPFSRCYEINIFLTFFVLFCFVTRSKRSVIVVVVKREANFAKEKIHTHTQGNKQIHTNT